MDSDPSLLRINYHCCFSWYRPVHAASSSADVRSGGFYARFISKRSYLFVDVRITELCVWYLRRSQGINCLCYRIDFSSCRSNPDLYWLLYRKPANNHRSANHRNGRLPGVRRFTHPWHCFMETLEAGVDIMMS